MFARRTAWDRNVNRFTAALERCRASGRRLLDLTESNPTRIGLSYPPGILEALTEAEGLHYRPDPRGLPQARSAVVDYYRAVGAKVPADNVLLTTGTSEAYSFLFRLLCDPGDQVLVARPSYPLFELLAGIQDVELVSYPFFYDHGWHIDVHELQQRITPKTRAIMLVHPNNPTGSFVQESERQQLNTIAAASRLALVCDEVFLDFGVEASAPFTFAANDASLTFTLSGLSKIAALPQMKLSWIVTSGPKPALDEALGRLEVICDTYLSSSTPVQLAAPKLLAMRNAIQQQISERVRTNLAELDRRLADCRATTRLRVDAGWYAVMRVPATVTDEERAITLLEQHSVVLHPGHFYDFAEDGYLVISLIVPPEVFAEAISRVLGSEAP